MHRTFVVALALLAAASAALAAEPQRIAQVKTVTGTAAVERGGGRVPLKVGDPLYQSDVVVTGSDGTVGLTFIDNTVFSTGPDSELALTEFHFDSSNFRGDMLADMRKGTLTVVSGDIARSSPGAMKIETPTAILGVRGTTFAIKVE